MLVVLKWRVIAPGADVAAQRHREGGGQVDSRQALRSKHSSKHGVGWADLSAARPQRSGSMLLQQTRWRRRMPGSSQLSSPLEYLVICSVLAASPWQLSFNPRHLIGIVSTCYALTWMVASM